MRLVVDANILVAAFLKDAVTRELLLDDRLDLVSPEYGLIETRDVLKRPTVLKRMKLNAAEFDWLWSAIILRIKVLPATEYKSMIHEARQLISDAKDVPYLACALRLECDIWSNDPDLQIPDVKARIGVISTQDLIKLLRP